MYNVAAAGRSHRNAPPAESRRAQRALFPLTTSGATAEAVAAPLRLRRRPTTTGCQPVLVGCRRDPPAATWNQVVHPRAAVVYVSDLDAHADGELGQNRVGLERRGGKSKGLSARRRWARWAFGRDAERGAQGWGWLQNSQASGKCPPNEGCMMAACPSTNNGQMEPPRRRVGCRVHGRSRLTLTFPVDHMVPRASPALSNP